MHQSDFQEEVSCSCSEKSDGHSNHYCQWNYSHPSSSWEYCAPSGSGTWILEELDEVQCIQWTKMSVEWRKDVPFQQLDLSGLEGWSEGNQAAAHTLLAEYHDISSMEPGALGCTNLEKYEIRVVDEEPFKEQFQRISPPMVDEVWAHMKEMLEAVAICPSQSPWCNAVVLVHKKYGGQHFCIDCHKLNARTKKDSYPLPQIQEAIKSLVWVGYFSCLDLKAGSWQIAMDEASKQYTAFNHGKPRIFQM